MARIKKKRPRRLGDGYPVPRIYHRKARGRNRRDCWIKGGDCDNKFEVYYGPQGADLEIAGVLASAKNWRRILLPLLKTSRRPRPEYRSLEAYLAERVKRDR
jgi:hypothetical protein